MNILIAGGSGFIGHFLIEKLMADHKVTVIGRHLAKLQRDYSPPITVETWDNLAHLDAKYFDVIINLCGHNIGDSRWNAHIKKELIDSRVKTSTTLINWAIQHQAKPRLICANAVGIYGLQENSDQQVFDENTQINFEYPRDFMSEIGVRWQQALQPAIDYGMSVTSTRFGVVLAKGQGMLKKLTPSFYFGMGSILGDGQQTISWVDIDDLVGALIYILKHPELTGAFNITSPHPISQAEFARTLASVMHRPLFLKMPALIVKMMFGEMGECLLLKGQRVIPTRLIEAGYVFRYPQLIDALQHEF